MKWLNGYRLRLVLIGFVAAIVIGGGASVRADFIWGQKADLPTTRYQPSTSVVGGKIYAFGGYFAGGWYDVYSRVDEYDPATDTWTRKADMPTARGYTSTCVVNEKIYVIGGDAGAEPISIVEVYDPATDTWAEQTELPTRRFWFSTNVVDGIIYVIGGKPGVYDGSPHLGTVEAYDPTTDIWTPKADMPTGRSFSSTCVVDGKIYVIGGAMPGKSAVEAYDPETNTWTVKAPMPTARYLLGASVVGGKIYAIGGYRHSINGPLYSTVEVYDPAKDIWTKGIDIPVPTAGLSTSVIDGKIYVIGGALTTHNGHPWVFTSAVYAFGIIVDFNGDGIVDADDMCIMIDHWGENYSLCDIGPTPLGDGIVDVQDLIVLAEHLFEDVNDPTLVAHWALDETEGIFAADSAGDNNGYALGDPIWKPDSGLVDGALQLDGVDDYVITSLIQNPTEESFSVLAWVRGGAPGQVVLSQMGGARWLCTDPDGNLMTELMGTGRGATELLSQTIITDGNWHRIGLVWDGSHKTLYVDGVAVAEDAQTKLEGSDNVLSIGTGTAMEPGTYWSGLIDDVRIYNRALSAEEIEALAQ